MNEQLRILIADDHPLFRKGLTTVLSADGDFDIVGEARNGKEAIEIGLNAQPDVLLVDLQMPEGGGMAVIRELSKQAPGIRLLVLTLFDDDDSVFLALRAGAHGYVLKDADEVELKRAIRAIGAGEAIFSPAIATKVLAFFAHPLQQAVPFNELTAREREILELIAHGQSNTIIAESLYLSIKTVANHVSNIFAKLQVTDRSSAIVRAREAGMGHS
jgi:DNA-binding NarL/FixJ family response regulator